MGLQERIELYKKIENSKIKEGVEFVFEQHSELSEIGTKERYSVYLDTVFSSSKVKDIVYKGTNIRTKEDYEDKDTLRRERGVFFSKSKDSALTYSVDTNTIIAARVNTQTPLILNADGNEFNKLSDAVKYLNKEYFDTNNLITDVKKDNKHDSVIIENVKDDRLAFKSKDISTTISVFEPEQIYILGSKQDIEGFKKYIEKYTESQS